VERVKVDEIALVISVGDGQHLRRLMALLDASDLVQRTAPTFTIMLRIEQEVDILYKVEPIRERECNQRGIPWMELQS
jgi:hypothetical protein